MPQPKVASSVVHLEVGEMPSVAVNSEKKFFSVVKSAFGQRRKTLVNALSKSPYMSVTKEEVIQALSEIGLDENIRGEKLSLEQFALLSNKLS